MTARAGRRGPAVEASPGWTSARTPETAGSAFAGAEVRRQLGAAASRAGACAAVLAAVVPLVLGVLDAHAVGWALACGLCAGPASLCETAAPRAGGPWRRAASSLALSAFSTAAGVLVWHQLLVYSVWLEAGPQAAQRLVEEMLRGGPPGSVLTAVVWCGPHGALLGALVFARGTNEASLPTHLLASATAFLAVTVPLHALSGAHEDALVLPATLALAAPLAFWALPDRSTGDRREDAPRDRHDARDRAEPGRSRPGGRLRVAVLRALACVVALASEGSPVPEGLCGGLRRRLPRYPKTR